VVVATHGRSFWILDDAAPLREATGAGQSLGPLLAAIAAAPAHLFIPVPAMRLHESDPYSMPIGQAGDNGPEGAVIDYVVGPGAPSLALEVVDRAGGTAFRTTSEKDAPIPLPTTPGMHRITWDLRYPLPDLIAGTVYNERSPRGVLAVPGPYTVKLIAGERTLAAPLTVVNDPRSSATHEALAQEFALATEVMAMLGEVHSTVRQINDVRSQIAALRAKATPELAPELDAVDQRADAILNVLFEPKAKTGVDLLNYPMRLNVRIAYLEDEIDFGDGAPTAQFLDMAAEYRAAFAAERARWKGLIETDLPALNQRLATRGLAAIVVR